MYSAILSVSLLPWLWAPDAVWCSCVGTGDCCHSLAFAASIFIICRLTCAPRIHVSFVLYRRTANNSFSMDESRIIMGHILCTLYTPQHAMPFQLRKAKKSKKKVFLIEAQHKAQTPPPAQRHHDDDDDMLRRRLYFFLSPRWPDAACEHWIISFKIRNLL